MKKYYSKEDLKKDIQELTIETERFRLLSRVIKVQVHIAKLERDNYSTKVIDFWKNVYKELRTKQVMNNYSWTTSQFAFSDRFTND
tara:strand:- start:806 stop:1063 length:258 start_codon:yes stop_codon:yes gene_type:complete